MISENIIMRVSIIVPVYNAEKVLHYCIDSILNQTFTDYELILVDDGSTDQSGRICKNYAHKNPRIKYICQQNSGVSMARNTGIRVASGDYICFVDSDDYIDATFLEELVAAIEKGYSFAMCGYNEKHDYIVDSDSKQIVYKSENETIATKQELMAISELVLLSQPWNKVFCRSVIVENNICFPEDLSLGEDTAFVYRYLSCVIEESFIVINKALYNYISVRNSCSLLNKYRFNLFDEYKKLNYILNYEITKWSLSKDQLQIFYNSCYYRMEMVLFNTFHSSNRMNDRQKIHYNSNVIKTNDFQRYYKNFKGKISFAFRVAYRIKSFFPIYIMMLIRGQKNDKNP